MADMTVPSGEQHLNSGIQGIRSSQAIDQGQQRSSQAEDRSRQAKLPEHELKDLSDEALAELKEQLNEALEPINIKLNFSEDQESGEWVVKVLDRESDEVIRQIPPEDMLRMARRIEELSAVFVDTWS